MTATAAPPVRAAPAVSPASLTGTWQLVRLQLRRDRVKLPGWVGGLGLMMLYIVSAIPAAYGRGEELADAAVLFAQPIGRMLVGPGYGADAEPTLERFVANGYGLYFLLLAAVMSILLVTRHTRLEEQTGRAELLGGGVVGRLAPLTAAMVLAAVANVAAALLVLAVMVGVGGLGVAGSVLFAAGLAVTGLAFSGITAVTVQLTEYARTSAGLAGIVLGASFVLRAVGDMAQQGGNALSWASPLGWGQQTAPFVLDRWWPLALGAVLALVTTAAGYVLAGRRDLAAGLRTVRPGPARATNRLVRPVGLQRRLHRGAIIGWTAGLVVGGAVFGAYADAMLAAAGEMPEALLAVFGGTEDVLAGYLAYMTTFMAYIVSMYAVLAVQALRGEETGGRAEPLLATPLSRRRWLWSNVGIVAAGVVVMLLATGVATGVAAAAVTGDTTHVWALTVAHLNQVPAVFVVLGLAVLLLGTIPRLLQAAWAVIVYGVLVGSFGPMLDVPDLAYDLSPFEHVARMPLEAFAPTPVVVLLALAAALLGTGVEAFRRRDLDLD